MSFRRRGGAVEWLTGALELAQVLEGAVESALEAVAAAFEGAAEDLVFGSAVVPIVGLGVLVFDVSEVIFPELGFGLAEPAEGPLGIDEDVDKGALRGGLGLVVEEILGGQGVEGRGVFAADDLGFTVNAGFQGILGRRGLALGGAGAGRFLGVQAVGLDL